MRGIKVIRTGRRLGGENGQFRHNRASNVEPGILQNKITRRQTSFPTNFAGKLSFIPSFLSLTASAAAIYIFSIPTCTTTVITLEPYALNAEFQRFNLM
jgi:hypothetical protein